MNDVTKKTTAVKILDAYNNGKSINKIVMAIDSSRAIMINLGQVKKTMKITQEDKELLEYLKANNKSDIFKYVNLICQTNSSNPDGHLYMQLGEHCMDQFFVEYYLNKDINTAKNWAKLSAWSFAESCQHKRGWDMWDNSKILPVVLSDDKALIERYSTLDTINIPERETKPYKEHENNPKSGQFDTIAMQYLLQSNWDKLHQMARYAQNVKTDQFQQWFLSFVLHLRKEKRSLFVRLLSVLHTQKFIIILTNI